MMIDGSAVHGLRAIASLARSAEKSTPTNRQVGAIRRIWNQAEWADGEHVPMPAFIAALDDAVLLLPSEAIEAVLFASEALYAAERAERQRIESEVVGTLVFLAGEGEYSHVQGVWIAMNLAGLEIDHSAVVRQLHRKHGTEVSTKYAHEATVAAALLSTNGGVVVVPAVESVH